MRSTAISLVLLVAACSGGQKGSGSAALPAPPGAGEPVAPPPAGPTAPPPDSGAPGAAAGNLVLEGTPPIPDDLRARLQSYLETRSASLADISDDGKAILIATRFGQSSQIHLVSQPGGARRQITFSREPTRGARFVPGSSSSVVFTRDVGGDENYQILRLDLDKNTTTVLTDGKSRNSGALWAPSGKRLAWASNARNGRDFDLWVSDGASPTTASLAVEGKGYWQPVDFSTDGKRLLILEYISITSSVLHLADLASKTVTKLTGEPAASYRDAVLAPDGKRAYITSDRDGEFVHLYEVDLAKKTWRPLTGDLTWNVDEIELSADGRTLAYVVNEGGISRVHLYDTRRRRAQPLKGIPNGLVYGLRFARRAPVLGFTLASATRTGDAYTYDLRRRKLTRWTESEMGGLDTSRMVEPTLIEFTSFDGRKIPAFYYKPKGAGPFPVVVDIHGGPEGQALPYFSPLTQFLVAEAGIAVLEPNVRGSDGYGKTYLTLDNGMKREDSVKDIGALLDWIGAQKELDARRVAVMGGSYGGYMVLASLVHFGERLVAGIDVVGISSFVTFLENTADYRRDLRRVEYGDERDPKMRKHLEAISPLNNVDRIKSALFVAQGANDPRVPASEAEQIVEAVRSRGHDVWYMLARDEGHGFAKRENRDTYMLLSILFLEKHLRK
ncbi:MAG TPA: S9 family peptidase [Kofleriaceae bacterium]|nr:S9 family peptidase [Kofleriaceae bacterium]